MVKKIILIFSFIIVSIFVLCKILYILNSKNEGAFLNQFLFYEQKNNTIDVLFLGTSHIHTGINPGILFKEYGIASYNFTSGGQTVVMSYYYLKEAFKYQKPKLIVFDAFSLSHIRTDELINRLGLLGIRLSFNKINLIKNVVDIKKWNDYFLPFNIIHTRYLDLTIGDFVKYKNNINLYKYYKGYVFGSSISSNYKIDVNNINEKYDINLKIEIYFRKIIELAKDNNIPILITVLPYTKTIFGDSKKHQAFYNKVRDITEEYNINFNNLNLSNEIKLNFLTDFSDTEHLNYKGAIKVSDYLGKYLKENYNLPDRRGDFKYYSWEMNAKYEYKRIYNTDLKEYTNLNEYIEKIKNADDYIIGITILGNYKKEDSIIKSIATNFNINDVYLNNASYVIDNNKLIYSSLGSNQYLFYDEIGSYTDLVVDSGKKLSINRQNYIRTQNGINIIIYDKFTASIVDNMYLEYGENSINPIIKR